MYIHITTKHIHIFVYIIMFTIHTSRIHTYIVPDLKIFQFG